MAATRGPKKGSRKTGGRTKGTPNRPTQELVARLAKKFPHFCAVETLAGFANDKSLSPELRMQAADRVAAYLLPKRKPVEAPITIQIPALEEGTDTNAIAHAVWKAVAGGEISIADGERLTAMLKQITEMQNRGQDGEDRGFEIRISGIGLESDTITPQKRRIE